MSSWIDESLILSELTGALLVLAVLWVVVLKNQLWQHWLRGRYQSALESVAAELGLAVVSGWRARIEARGRRAGVKVKVQWRAGAGPHKLTIRARRAWRSRRWTGAPDTPAPEVLAHVERLVGELGG
ncbi:MAG: hypothetical protein ABIO70_25700 [Pseudomonadota bacterium]